MSFRSARFKVIFDENLASDHRSTRDQLVLYCMFTDPSLARVGLSENDAQRRGIAFRVAKLPIVAVLRSRTTSETRSFMKALVEAHGEHILGFTMLGAQAGEVMAVVQTAMLTDPTPVCATRSSRTRPWRKDSSHSLEYSGSIRSGEHQLRCVGRALSRC